MELLLLLQMIGIAFISGLIGEYRRSVFDVTTLTFQQFSANVIAGSLLAILIGALIHHIIKSNVITIISTGLLSYQNTDNLENLAKNIINKVFNKVKK